MTPERKLPVTLVLGGNAAGREEGIRARLAPGQDIALILEGLADGIERFNQERYPQLRCARIAPACLCCTGNLTLRVTLNRILRHPPQHLYISLANSEHLPALCNFLGGAQYVGWLLPPVILDVGRAAIT